MMTRWDPMAHFLQILSSIADALLFWNGGNRTSNSESQLEKQSRLFGTLVLLLILILVVGFAVWWHLWK